MGFGLCARCKLMLPSRLLRATNARTSKGKIITVSVCLTCYKEIDRERKTKNV